VITDGDETCAGDPAAERQTSHQWWPDRKVHVIGTPSTGLKTTKSCGAFPQTATGCTSTQQTAQSLQRRWQTVELITTIS